MLLNHNTSIFIVKKISLNLKKYVKILLHYVKALILLYEKLDYTDVLVSSLDIITFHIMMY